MDGTSSTILPPKAFNGDTKEVASLLNLALVPLRLGQARTATDVLALIRIDGRARMIDTLKFLASILGLAAVVFLPNLFGLDLKPAGMKLPTIALDIEK